MSTHQFIIIQSRQWTYHQYYLSTTVQPYHKNIKNTSIYAVPVRAAWQVLHGRQAVHHRTQKNTTKCCVAWRNTLSCQAVFGRFPIIYEIQHEVQGKTHHSSHGINSNDKTHLSIYEQLPLPDFSLLRL